MPQTTVTQTFNSFRDKLSSFIGKRVPRMEDAEDILQEVFYQFVRISEIGEPIEQPAAWLYRVTRNLIINGYKKKKETQYPLVNYDDEDDEDGANFLDEIEDIIYGEEATPETEYLRSLILDEIKAAVNELPPEQREVFELTEYYDMPIKEIAKNTGVPENTVLSRKHYAVVYLRKTLGELYANIVER
ncbi:MAG: sigma-70 family RNA polymerase sigma factor [Treponema sp.]|jgi:RNA polymerase sigma factor (sigma-70 family)|nr:sigma-70 family RNA polymerase sigma factor [Treponema sp.]